MIRSVTFFIPVYNEEALLVPNTERLRQFLAALPYSFEILIGSNGSTDQTPALGRALETQYADVHFFHLPKRGPGAAFREALNRMRGEALISLDMDLSADLAFIPEAVHQLDTYDIVIGSKKMGIESRSIYRRLGSDLFIAASRWLLKLLYDDYSLGAKAYRKPILEKYKSVIDTGTFYVQHIIYRAHRDGAKILQIPVHCTDHRQSRFNLLTEGLSRFARLGLLALTSKRQTLVPGTKV